jgi:site-specific DNA recombinase
VPEAGELAITLRGDLAAMLSMAADKKKSGIPGREAGLCKAALAQESLVAGTGFEPVTFRL